jgi:hypothetical protein
MEPSANPFAALSLIVAPAILTNASSVLAMSTSNRLARAVDRARDLVRQVETDGNTPARVSHLLDLRITEDRALLLLRVLRSFYVGLAAFATATLVSLIGAVVVSSGGGLLGTIFETLAIVAGIVGVGGLSFGALLLVRETRLAVANLQRRVGEARAAAVHDDDANAGAQRPA